MAASRHSRTSHVLFGFGVGLPNPRTGGKQQNRLRIGMADQPRTPSTRNTSYHSEPPEHIYRCHAYGRNGSRPSDSVLLRSSGYPAVSGHAGDKLHGVRAFRPISATRYLARWCQLLPLARMGVEAHPEPNCRHRSIWPGFCQGMSFKRMQSRSFVALADHAIWRPIGSKTEGIVA